MVAFCSSPLRPDGTVASNATTVKEKPMGSDTEAEVLRVLLDDLRSALHMTKARTAIKRAETAYLLAHRRLRNAGIKL